MGVSKNRGTPKWMVYFMENLYLLMDDLGGKPHYFQKKKHPYKKNVGLSVIFEKMELFSVEVICS